MTVEIVRVGYGHPDAVMLIEQVQAEYVVRYGGEDATPLDPAMFEPPRGAFFVAYRDGVPVATGAWRCEVPMRESPVAARASRCEVWIFEGPAPKRPSAGSRSVGI